MPKESIETKVALNTQSIGTIKERIKGFVTSHEFLPVKAIAFGFAGLVLTAVGGAILAFFIRSPK